MSEDALLLEIVQNAISLPYPKRDYAMCMLRTKLEAMKTNISYTQLHISYIEDGISCIIDM